MKTITEKTTILIILSYAVSASFTLAEQRTSSDTSIAQAASSEVDNVSELPGTSWILKSWSNKNLDASKSGITASFSIVTGKSKVSGRGAPNTYSAFYKSKADGSFSIETIGSTERSPSDEETLYFSLLRQARKYEIIAENLVLSSKEGKELLVFQRK